MAQRQPVPHSIKRALVTEVSVENFRCFSTRQDVPIAPLTLLVGENSTGKTSFMAITQVLWDMAIKRQSPTFKKDPFDLGGFDEIISKSVHTQDDPTLTASLGLSEARFSSGGNGRKKIIFGDSSDIWRYSSSFHRRGDVPSLLNLTVSQGPLSIEERFENYSLCEVVLSNGSETWSVNTPEHVFPSARPVDGSFPSPDQCMAILYHFHDILGQDIDEDVVREFRKFVDRSPFSKLSHLGINGQLYATSPVRSKPRRTYHATNFTPDPEGNYIPFYLANSSTQDSEHWKSIQYQMEDFGRRTELFNTLSIKRSTELDGAPFQVHVGLEDTEDFADTNRSLVDIGYGVSQVLPILVSLLDQDSAQLTLMQQPEIHLHPRAQAALGDLFCDFVENAGRQLIVETHSDYLIERVRLLVKEGSMDPAFVVILFFERNGSDVRIHTIRFDQLGNVHGAPRSYRSFFLSEMDRSFGL